MTDHRCAICHTQIFWNIISQAWIHADRSARLDTHRPVKETPA